MTVLIKDNTKEVEKGIKTTNAKIAKFIVRIVLSTFLYIGIALVDAQKFESINETNKIQKITEVTNY